MQVNLYFEVCRGHENEGIKMPERATKHSVGYDFYSPTRVVLEPHTRAIIPTHVKCYMPRDIWLGIFSRSSLVKKGLHHYLGCGVIDSDYYGNENNDGDIGIVIENTSDTTVEISKGEKIAQGIFFPAIYGYDEVDTERVGGFGSTDKERQ